MLNPKQAAATANVSLSLIYAWCHDGVLPHTRLGRKGRRGKIVISDEDLAAVVASFRVAARKEPGRKPAPKSAFKHLKFS